MNIVRNNVCAHKAEKFALSLSFSRRTIVASGPRPVEVLRLCSSALDYVASVRLAIIDVPGSSYFQSMYPCNRITNRYVKTRTDHQAFQISSALLRSPSAGNAKLVPMLTTGTVLIVSQFFSHFPTKPRHQLTLALFTIFGFPIMFR